VEVLLSPQALDDIDLVEAASERRALLEVGRWQQWYSLETVREITIVSE
jgi:hypothetical protein